jgi:hypothetical protein
MILTWNPAFRMLLEAFNDGNERIMLLSGINNAGFLESAFWQRIKNANPYLASSVIIEEYEKINELNDYPGGNLEDYKRNFGKILKSPDYRQAKFEGAWSEKEECWYLDKLNWYLAPFVLVPLNLLQESINYKQLKL